MFEWNGTPVGRFGQAGMALAFGNCYEFVTDTTFNTYAAHIGSTAGGSVTIDSAAGCGNGAGTLLVTKIALSSVIDIGNNNDSGMSRSAAGVIAFGNSAAGDTTAKLKAAGYMAVGATFTSNGGCTESLLVGGATAGKFTVGQNTACTIVITMGNSATAPNGWVCTAYDQTAVPAVAIRQTASSTTTCSLLMTVGTNDVVVFSAMGY